MSGYPKILWGITVPSGDWDFGFNDGAPRVATIPAGAYDNIFDLADQLQTRMNAASAVNFVVEVSSIGTVTIDGDAAWNTAWGTTDDDCSEAFGFRETEAVGGGNILTALDAHLYGYYPGTISYGRATSRGAGLTAALRWDPDCHEVRVVAGSRVTRSVAVSTPTDTGELSCSIIACDAGLGADEWGDANRGARAWRLACASRQFHFFPDRYVGTVATWAAATLVEGTDYYTMAFAGQLRSRASQHPSYCTWSVPVNWEAGP